MFPLLNHFQTIPETNTLDVIQRRSSKTCRKFSGSRDTIHFTGVVLSPTANPAPQRAVIELSRVEREITSGQAALLKLGQWDVRQEVSSLCVGVAIMWGP